MAGATRGGGAGGVAGLEPAGGAGNCTLQVEGMDCGGCARTVEGALRDVPGVREVRTDVMTRRVAVSYDPDAVSARQVERVVARLGMKPTRLGAPAPASRWARHGRALLAALAGLLWVGVLAANAVPGGDRWAGALALATVAVAGWHVFPRGLRAALSGALDMYFLMSAAAVGALLLGEWEEAASVMFLFAVAQLLESRAMDRARHAITALMELSPVEASVLRDGRERRVPVAEVAVGEVVLVRPGEKMPVDGSVMAGASLVDQAPITGESVPVLKEQGAEVFAGTLNGDGALEVRTGATAEDSTLARIIHAVEDARASRAPSEAFVDRFARIYTPVVVATAILVAVVPPLLAGGVWGEWFYRALVLLVVACPCALVISTPVTVVSALAGAARRGILIKGGRFLEVAGRARVIALDKTGTLTRGEPEVIDVVPLDGATPAEVLAAAAAVEERSEHPLARAVVRRAEAEGLSWPAAADATAVPGRGVRASVRGESLLAGSPRMFSELAALPDGLREMLRRIEGEGRTAVLVGRASDDPGGGVAVLGAIVLADAVRPQAVTALKGLRAEGVAHLAMLTGDSAGSAESLAGVLRAGGAEVDLVRAGLLPEDKVSAVAELRRRYGPVLMVGDGVNDAPALAAADVGVAMGAAGSDVALETADIALMADDLSRLPVLVRLARRAEGIIRVNIGFSLLTKAVFVLLALTGHATLWMAVFADMGASLLVVLNGMRALRA